MYFSKLKINWASNFVYFFGWLLAAHLCAAAHRLRNPGLGCSIVARYQINVYETGLQLLIRNVSLKMYMMIRVYISRVCDSIRILTFERLKIQRSDTIATVCDWRQNLNNFYWHSLSYCINNILKNVFIQRYIHVIASVSAWFGLMREKQSRVPIG